MRVSLSKFHSLKRFALLGLFFVALNGFVLAEEMTFRPEKIETEVGRLSVPGFMPAPQKQELNGGQSGYVSMAGKNILLVQIGPASKELDESRASQVVDAFVSGFPDQVKEKTRRLYLKPSSLPIPKSYRGRIVTEVGETKETGISISQIGSKNLMIFAVGFTEEELDAILKTFEPTENADSGTGNTSAGPAQERVEEGTGYGYLPYILGGLVVIFAYMAFRPGKQES